MFKKLFKSFYFLKTLFSKIILLFILLIFITISLIGSLSYKYFYKIISEEVVNTSKITLVSISKDINLKVSNLQNIILQVLNNNLLREFYYYENSDTVEALFQERKFSKELSKLQGTYEDITQLWLYSNKENFFITPAGIISADYFFNNVYKQSETLTFSLKNTLSQYHSLSLVGKSDYEYYSFPQQSFVFMRSLPLYEEKPQGQIIFNLNPNFFNELVDTSLFNEAFSLILTNDDMSHLEIFGSDSSVSQSSALPLLTSLLENELLMENKMTEVTFDHIPYNVLYLKPMGSNLKYIGLINKQILANQLNIICSGIFIISILCFIASTVIAFSLIKRICSPIKQMIDDIYIITHNSTYLPKNITTPYEYDDVSLIKDFIYSEYDQNIALHSEITHIQSITLQNILLVLLTSNTEPALTSYEKTLLKNVFHNENYKIVIIKPSYNVVNIAEENILHIIDTTLQATDDSLIYYLVKHIKEIIIVLNFSSLSNITLINDKLTLLQNELLSHGYYMGVGGITHYIETLYQSYSEALLIIKNNLLIMEESHLSANNISHIDNYLCLYTQEQESKLIAALKTIDTKEVHSLLNSIIKENQLKYSICISNINSLFSQLIFTLIRTASEFNIDAQEIFKDKNPFSYMENLVTLSSKEDYLFELYNFALIEIGNRKLDKKSDIYSQTLEYIHTQYYTDASLNEISYKLNISPSYLSTIFKEKNGLNFLDYLNNYRVEVAQKLLLEENASVSELAEKVGFTNVNTFIRVFKKHCGTTPGKYKLNNK